MYLWLLNQKNHTLMDRFQVPDPNPLINCKPNILILLQRSIMLADLEVSSEGTCFYNTTDPEGGSNFLFQENMYH